MRPPRRVEPVHLLVDAGRWYLLAWDLDRDDWRTFRIDRISPRIPTGPRFTPRPVPGGDPGAFVAARFRGAERPGIDDGWPCRGVVRLATSADTVAPYLETHRDARVTPLGPDRCEVALGAWSWVGLAATIAQWDADIDAVEPVELAQAFGLLARRCDAAVGVG